MTGKCLACGAWCDGSVCDQVCAQRLQDEKGQAEPDVTDYEIVNTMDIFGGSFARSIAAAARCADPDNLMKLKAAFPELWQEYADVVRLRRARAQASA